MTMLELQIREAAWSVLAFVVSRRPVAEWLIRRAKRRPYFHIHNRNKATPYMRRWWLFNPRAEDNLGGWLPSIRVHHILEPDDGVDFHDHPWNARTIILRGWYEEQRRFYWYGGGHTDIEYKRKAGNHAGLYHGERFGGFHRIDRVSEGGCYTLFIYGRWRGQWGFAVDGKKIAANDYFRSIRREHE